MNSKAGSMAQNFSRRPFLFNQSARLLMSHGGLLWRIAVTELRTRYAGSLLGLGWVVLGPLSILGTHATVYMFIFRLQLAGMTRFENALYIFAGLIPFLMTAEALSVGVGSIVANKSVLNNTVFPIDLVPAKAVLLSQGTMTVGLCLLLPGIVLTDRLAWTVLLVPLVWALHAFALLGLIWILSMLHVVIRDLQNLIAVLLLMLLVASPIAYTPDMVPSSLKAIVIVNPFAYFVIAYQQLLILGQWPSLQHMTVLGFVSLGLFLLGSSFFARAKRVMIEYV